MATSGTVGLTVIDTAMLLEHAFRRVRVNPALQSPETVESAKENLYLLLLALVNRGLNLWCLDSNFIGLENGKATYGLPVGAIDLTNVVYCQPTRVSGTDTVAATSVTTDLGSSSSVVRVGLKFSAISSGTTIVVESSTDNVTWVQIAAPSETWAADTWYWFNLDVSTSAQYFRVTGDAAITVTEFYLASQSADLPVLQWNRDTWSTINNKFQIGRPSTNYYFEKKIDPTLTLWPIPNNDYDHLLVLTERQVQDIGSLSQQIEVPQRWVEAVIWQLAVRLAYELPQVDASMIPVVVQMADKMLIEVEREESDGAPIMLQPNVGVYTR